MTPPAARREPLFHQFPGFTESWDRHGLTDADLFRLERLLIAHPDRGPVVPGGGGLRKVRFAPPGRGKRGGVRVFYANLPGVGVVLLGAVIAKSERANLTPTELRTAAAAVSLIERWYADRQEHVGADDD